MHLTCRQYSNRPRDWLVLLSTVWVRNRCLISISYVFPNLLRPAPMYVLSERGKTNEKRMFATPSVPKKLFTNDWSVAITPKRWRIWNSQPVLGPVMVVWVLIKTDSRNGFWISGLSVNRKSCAITLPLIQRIKTIAVFSYILLIGNTSDTFQYRLLSDLLFHQFFIVSVLNF